MASSNPRTSGQMTIHLPGVIKTLGEAMYSDPSVSVRELVQNANDACIVRQADDSTAPPSEIHVRFDAWKRILVVEDNGAGMTEDEVKQFLTVIGSSHTDQMRTLLESSGRGTLAERLIGRFGLGLLSAFIIGERVEFTTLSYKEGSTPVWWECDGGQEYTMGPSDSKDRPGTVVTIHVSAKHIGILKDDKLSELIRMYADLLTIPIFIDPMPNPVNVMMAPWDRQATEAEYRQFINDRYPHEAVLDVIPIEIEEGGLKIGGVLFVPKQPVLIIREHGDLIIYVRRMFVCKDERSLLPDWAKFVKGVISSPNLRETTSREAILHDENFQQVQKALGEKILDYLTQVSTDNPRLFKEIVTNHNIVIKAWAIASDQLFDRIKDIVLFQTDAGMINLQRYFETSRFSKGVGDQLADKRYIFYFTTPGGMGQNTILFSARGLRVIDAQHFPDEGFLQKYAETHPDVILRRLDVGGSFIFEELERPESKWADLEDVYSRQRVDAKIVRFLPDDIPAVLIYPEAEPVTDQVDRLLSDPNLSPNLKSLVSQLWEDQQKQRKSRLTAGGVLYVNANNQIIQKLSDLDLEDYEVQDVMIVIYNNALMLSTQGPRMYLAPESAKKIFEGNNRAIAALMAKIYQVRELEARLLNETGAKIAQNLVSQENGVQTTSPHSTDHITCFVALPFREEYQVVIEALRDVLEAPPYFWQVERADKRFFSNEIPDNIGHWIASAQCFAVDLSDGNENVMMELGHMYWGFSKKPLLLLQREGTERKLADLGGRLRIFYPWSDPPNQTQIAEVFHTEIAKFDEIQHMRGLTHFLSIRSLKAEFIPSRMANEIAKRYQSIEDFLALDTKTISNTIGVHIAPEGVVRSIQDYLRDLIAGS